MKFDTLCNIILEDKKQQKFARIIITNPNPTFSLDDVLRDPDDPSKGVKTYLDEHLKGSEYGEPIDDERLARRALRRLNWVAGSLIKRIGSRELDLRKLHINIIILLEKYLKNVLKYSDEQIEKMELKIAKEAAFVGNVILPPSERYPHAKGVFTVAKDDIEFKGSKGKPVGVEEFNVADRLRKEFNMTVDEYLASFDPDLIGTIKDIIKDNESKTSLSSTKFKPEEDDIDSTIGFGTDEGGESEDDELEESASLTFENASISTILKDPRIKNIYDPRIVRKVIKSMISLGSLKQDENGELVLAEPGEEDWRMAINRTRSGDTEEVGDEIEIETPIVLSSEPGEVEDEDNPNITPEDKAAATRLGYMSTAREEGGSVDIGEDEEDEDEKPWYK